MSLDQFLLLAIETTLAAIFLLSVLRWIAEL
jgi:hypothetical protein